MSKTQELDSAISKIIRFHKKPNWKFIPVAFGCDLHLADEIIKNQYCELVNNNVASKEWGEPFVRCMYLGLMEDEVWLQRCEVEQLIEYAQAWLTKEKEGSLK